MTDPGHAECPHLRGYWPPELSRSPDARFHAAHQPEAALLVPAGGVSRPVPDALAVADLVLAVRLGVVQVTGQHVRSRHRHLPNL